MSRLALSLLVVLFAAVFCAEEVQLNSFEGTYLIDDVTGGVAYFCQDGDKVWGTYLEVGIIKGGVTADKLTGSFFSAGLGPCVLGTVDLDLQDYGIIGVFQCNDQVSTAGFFATKISSFRPTDTQCGIGPDTNTDDTLEGRWINDQQLTLDLCFVDFSASNYTVHGSLQRVDSEGNIVDWYVTGYWVDNGRVIVGTWYQDFSAGAILFYLRNNGKVEYYWWTGLIYDQGQTYIDYNQLNNPAKHGVSSYKRPLSFVEDPTFPTTSDRCEKYDGIRVYVLRNLPRDQDQDYYYFVDVEYLDEIVRVKPVLDTANGATTLAVSLLVLLVTLVALI